ncbi:MAG: hypothetical protein ACR2NZ_08875 [Rubripirellula sp.]
MNMFNLYLLRPIAWRCQYLVLLLTLSCSSNALQANPNAKDPSKPLAAHGTIDGASELVASLYQVYDEEFAFVTKTLERSDNPASYSERQIAKSAARLWKAKRDVKLLELMGEPATFDLARKVRLLIDQMYVLAHAYAGTPKGSQVLVKLSNKLKRELPRYQEFLRQAEAALQKGGDPEVFVTQMESKGMQMQADLVFFRAAIRTKYWRQFPQLMIQGDEKRNRARRAQYLEEAKSKIKNHLAAADAFPAEAANIRGQIAASGMAKLGDQDGDPVEAFAYLADRWAIASAGLTRAAGTQWAITNRIGTQDQPRVLALRESALAELAGIVEATAVSVKPDQVPRIYSDLLKQMSVLDRRMIGFGMVSQACEPALAKLAAKNPTFANQVEAYQRATSEPLKWRRGFASQQAKNLSKSFPLASVTLKAKSLVEKDIRPDFVRKMNRETVVAPQSINAPADWIVYEAATRLVGKPVRDDKLIRLSPTSRSAVVPYRMGHYANVPVPFPSEAEVADLRQAIVVDETHGPLSTEAAHAVSAAELHDYLTVAGLVQNVHLESAVTRLISLPDLASPLITLGNLAVLDDTMSPLQQTCWRLDIKPMWAHNRYFTVRMKSK